MRKTVGRWPVRATGILVLVTLLSLLTAGVALAYDPTGQRPGITKEATSMHHLYLFVTAIALVVFVAVEAAVIFMVVRFRKRNDELPPQIHGNNVLEMIWTAIPVIIVLALFVGSFIVLVDVEGDADAKDLTVDVTGFQFSWQFDYHVNDLGTRGSENTDEVISVIGTADQPPVLRIPSDERVEFALQSHDVIHSFYIRDFLYKLDVIPGRDNRFVVTATKEGTYQAQCAELCGVDHSVMRFTLQVMSRDEFDQWIQQQRAEAAKSAQAP